MNQEIKQKWVAALRSGDYIQMRLLLGHNENGKKQRCCLGVLCDVMGRAQHMESGVLNDDGCLAYPTLDTLLRAGLESDMSEHLALKNDLGASFFDIANFIEENL